MKIKFIKEYKAFMGIENPFNSRYDYEAGEIRDASDETAQWLIDNGFAEEVKESGWWKPMAGDRYYFIDDSGCIKQDTWRNSFWQVDRYKMGNVFKTEEATERYKDYLKAIATVRQDEGVLTPEEIRDVSWAQPMPYVGVSLDNELGVCQKNVEDEVVIASATYFDTKEHAQASLDEHWNEWKIIANYDWSRE